MSYYGPRRKRSSLILLSWGSWHANWKAEAMERSASIWTHLLCHDLYSDKFLRKDLKPLLTAIRCGVDIDVLEAMFPSPSVGRGRLIHESSLLSNDYTKYIEDLCTSHIITNELFWTKRAVGVHHHNDTLVDTEGLFLIPRSKTFKGLLLQVPLMVEYWLHHTPFHIK
eukprot:GHVH01000326.1.p1 GENE.GHVH01000326.1~~GHVH01000326.1.p1  ORF type:complete len:168 (-),score=14.91 GHVH01000326.1:89-592(-)